MLDGCYSHDVFVLWYYLRYIVALLAVLATFEEEDDMDFLIFCELCAAGEGQFGVSFLGYLAFRGRGDRGEKFIGKVFFFEVDVFDSCFHYAEGTPAVVAVLRGQGDGGLEIAFFRYDGSEADIAAYGWRRGRVDGHKVARERVEDVVMLVLRIVAVDISYCFLRRVDMSLSVFPDRSFSPFPE